MVGTCWDGRDYPPVLRRQKERETYRGRCGQIAAYLFIGLVILAVVLL